MAHCQRRELYQAERPVPEFHQSDLKDAIIKGYYGEGGYTSVQPINTVTPQPTPLYNLQGRRVASSDGGIYIQDGKKVLR